jgi:protein-S-isoprenylcysteine O-methyltransferase Ste14
MRIGGSLALIALGAILKFAVTDSVSGINIGTIGVILMVVGVIALVITVAWMSTRRRTDVVQHQNGTTYVTPREPMDTI